MSKSSDKINLSKIESNRADERSFLQVFPAEVWIKVLNNLLTDCDCLVNPCQAFSFFRNLLIDHRQIFLFPKVFRILVSSIFHQENSDTKTNKITVPSEILTLRLVCKFWNQCIEKYYETQYNPNFKYCFAACLESNRQGYLSPNQFIQHFTSTHKNTTKNPFFTRHLELRYDDLENYEDDESPEDIWKCHNAALNMVEQYGKHVWYFTYQYTDEAPFSEQSYQRLYHILELMPNLKHLRIQFNWNDTEELQIAGQLPFFENIVINCKALPRFENLEAVAVVNSPSFVLNSVLTSNVHIKELCIHCVQYNVEYNLHLREFPNLKYLHFQTLSEQNIFKRDSPSVSWPLETLSLDLSKSKISSVQSLFQPIQLNWQYTLTELTLSLPCLKSDPATAMPSLELSHLHTLTLKLENYCTLDFLLPIKFTLKYLSLQFNCWNSTMTKISQDLQIAVKMEETVKLLSVIDNPIQSNIWKIFEKLERVSYEDWGRLDGVKWTMSRKEWTKSRNKILKIDL